jgi:hypothetical protein
VKFDALPVNAFGRISTEMREHIAGYIATFAGKSIDIVVRQHKAKRSLDQNSYLHAEPFPKLAAKWGESVDRTKLICMAEFWGWEPVTVKGVRAFLPVKSHTSDMTVQECTLFINWLIPWAAQEHSVEIALPDEWREAA